MIYLANKLASSMLASSLNFKLKNMNYQIITDEKLLLKMCWDTYDFCIKIRRLEEKEDSINVNLWFEQNKKK